MSHHILRRLDLHGDVSGGRWSRDRLVKLLLKNPAGLEQNRSVNHFHQERKPTDIADL